MGIITVSMEEIKSLKRQIKARERVILGLVEELMLIAKPDNSGLRWEMEKEAYPSLESLILKYDKYKSYSHWTGPDGNCKERNDDET